MLIANKPLSKEQLNDLARRAENPLQVLGNWIREYADTFGYADFLKAVPAANAAPGKTLNQDEIKARDIAFANIEAFRDTMEERRGAAKSEMRRAWPIGRNIIDRALRERERINLDGTGFVRTDLTSRRAVTDFIQEVVKPALFAEDGARKPELDKPFDPANFSASFEERMRQWSAQYKDRLAAAQTAYESWIEYKRKGMKAFFAVGAISVLIIAAGVIAGGPGAVVTGALGLALGSCGASIPVFGKRGTRAQSQIVSLYSDLARGTEQNLGRWAMGLEMLQEYARADQKFAEDFSAARVLIGRLSAAKGTKTVSAAPQISPTQLPNRQNEGR